MVFGVVLLTVIAEVYPPSDLSGGGSWHFSPLWDIFRSPLVYQQLPVVIPTIGVLGVSIWWFWRRRCLLLFALPTLLLGTSWALPAYLFLAGVAVLLAVVDLQHAKLPDRVVVPSLGRSGPPQLELRTAARADCPRVEVERQQFQRDEQASVGEVAVGNGSRGARG